MATLEAVAETPNAGFSLWPFTFGKKVKSSSSSSSTSKGTNRLTATGSGSPSKGTRKVLCRYGMGCTHVSDPVHRERFWHPPVPELSIPPGTYSPQRPLVTTAATISCPSTNTVPSTSTFQPLLPPQPYTCHECGLGFKDLTDLQIHIKRKTAWSNKSLVGCRISCLVDNREWHEGFILEFSAITGKHRVSLEQLGEVRWLNMLRTAFFIVQRPMSLPGVTPQSEAKEVEVDMKGLDMMLAPIETWTYVEEITGDYARAQSMMHWAYGGKIQETGHKTQGHLCVTEQDKVLAKDAKSSLLYGELLPRGINKAIGPGRLEGEKASVVYELGMGIGKVAMQVFLQFPNLTRVYGVELSTARFVMAEEAAKALCEEHPDEYAVTQNEPGQSIRVTNKVSGGVLDMEVGNLLLVNGIETADIVLLETDLAPTIYADLCGILRRLKKGARAFTYLDLRKIWTSGVFPYRQLDINRPISDRYATSWSVNRGHHFFLWVKLLEGEGPWEGMPVAGELALVNGGEEVVRRQQPRQPSYQSMQHHTYPSSREEARRRASAHRAENQHCRSPVPQDPTAGRGTVYLWFRSFRKLWRNGTETPTLLSDDNSHHPCAQETSPIYPPEGLMDSSSQQTPRAISTSTTPGEGRGAAVAAPPTTPATAGGEGGGMASE